MFWVTIYVRNHNSTDDTCTANAIQDLCIERENWSYNERGDLNCIICRLCTDWVYDNIIRTCIYGLWLLMCVIIINYNVNACIVNTNKDYYYYILLCIVITIIHKIPPVKG